MYHRPDVFAIITVIHAVWSKLPMTIPFISVNIKTGKRFSGLSACCKCEFIVQIPETVYMVGVGMVSHL